MGRIGPALAPSVSILIDGQRAEAIPGETVLTVLLSRQQKAISRSDRGLLSGAYCGMGVCFSCLVLIDGIKSRACQAEVQEGMRITTQKSLFQLYGPALPEEAGR